MLKEEKNKTKRREYFPGHVLITPRDVLFQIMASSKADSQTAQERSEGSHTAPERSEGSHTAPERSELSHTAPEGS